MRRRWRRGAAVCFNGLLGSSLGASVDLLRSRSASLIGALNARQAGTISMARPMPAKDSLAAVLGSGVGIWFLVWTIASPTTCALALGSAILVSFKQTRALGQVVSMTSVIVGIGLALLFWKARGIALRSTAHVWDLVSPEERARSALANAKLCLLGAAIGLVVAVFVLGLARRHRHPPA